MIDKPGVLRLSRYASVGISTFVLDLAIVYGLTQGGMNYLLAVAIGYAIGVTLNYVITRPWVFKRTKRTFRSGFIYSTISGVAMFLMILGCTALLVSAFGWQLFPARILVGIAVGFLNYLFNLYVTFRVAGKH